MDTTNRSALKRVLRITSHIGYGRYLHSLDFDSAFVGWIPRQDIASPYAYSPTHGVYHDPQRGNVIIVETSHKRYDVFAVPADLKIYTDDDDAMAVHLANPYGRHIG